MGVVILIIHSRKFSRVSSKYLTLDNMGNVKRLKFLTLRTWNLVEEARHFDRNITIIKQGSKMPSLWRESTHSRDVFSDRRMICELALPLQHLSPVYMQHGNALGSVIYWLWRQFCLVSLLFCTWFSPWLFLRTSIHWSHWLAQAPSLCVFSWHMPISLMRLWILWTSIALFSVPPPWLTRSWGSPAVVAWLLSREHFKALS